MTVKGHTVGGTAISPEVAAEALHETLWHLSIMHSIGDDWPSKVRTRERMKNVSVGDFVTERRSYTAAPVEERSGYSSPPPIDAVGVLEKIGKERVRYDDPTLLIGSAYLEPETKIEPEAVVYHLRTLDGRLVRWAHARFVAVPWGHPKAILNR